jgi:hypothetical protein
MGQWNPTCSQYPQSTAISSRVETEELDRDCLPMLKPNARSMAPSGAEVVAPSCLYGLGR